MMKPTFRHLSRLLAGIVLFGPPFILLSACSPDSDLRQPVKKPPPETPKRAGIMVPPIDQAAESHLPETIPLVENVPELRHELQVVCNLLSQELLDKVSSLRRSKVETIPFSTAAERFQLPSVSEEAQLVRNKIEADIRSKHSPQDAEQMIAFLNRDSSFTEAGKDAWRFTFRASPDSPDTNFAVFESIDPGSGDRRIKKTLTLQEVNDLTGLNFSNAPESTE